MPAGNESRGTVLKNSLRAMRFSEPSPATHFLVTHFSMGQTDPSLVSRTFSGSIGQAAVFHLGKSGDILPLNRFLRTYDWGFCPF